MKQHFQVFSQLMDEAAQVIRRIPEKTARSLKIRIHLIDELEGASGMLRNDDAKSKFKARNLIVAWQNPYKLYELYTDDQLEPAWREMMIPLFRGPFRPSEDANEEFERFAVLKNLPLETGKDGYLDPLTRVSYEAWTVGRDLLMKNVDDAIQEEIT